MHKMEDVYGDTIIIEPRGATAFVIFEMVRDCAIMELDAPALREFITGLTTALDAVEGTSPDRTNP